MQQKIQFPRTYEILRKVNLIGLGISATALGAMMLLVVVDVVGRISGTTLIGGVFEISEKYLMPLSIFPALGFVYASGVMPRFDVVLEKVSGWVQTVVVYGLLLLELVTFSLIAWLTFEDFSFAVEGGTTFHAGGATYPLWAVKLFVPVGFALIAVETLFLLIINSRNNRYSFTVSEAVRGDLRPHSGL